MFNYLALACKNHLLFPCSGLIPRSLLPQHARICVLHCQRRQRGSRIHPWNRTSFGSNAEHVHIARRILRGHLLRLVPDISPLLDQSPIAMDVPPFGDPTLASMSSNDHLRGLKLGPTRMDGWPWNVSPRADGRHAVS